MNIQPSGHSASVVRPIRRQVCDFQFITDFIPNWLNFLCMTCEAGLCFMPDHFWLN